MKPRQIILYGLVITALCTALLVTDIVPALVVAFFGMGLGMVLSYYMALSQQRGNLIGDIETQNRILEKIQSQGETRDALRQLCIWSNWLVSGEDAVLWLEGSGVIAETAPGSGSDWTATAEGISYGSEVFMINKKVAVQQEGPNNPTWEELMVVNDSLTDGRRLVLFLINPQKKLLQDAMLFRILHDTRYILERDMNQQEANACYKQLVNIALNAAEQGETSFGGHGERVEKVALLLGRRLRLQEEEMKVLEYAALIHDIGKTIKPEEADTQRQEGSETEGGNTEQGMDSAFDHASLGAGLIPDYGWWNQVREAVKYHHERYDGSGYPEGLKQYDIPLGARIIAVADLYDALTRLVPEEERLDSDDAVAVIKRATGIWFDPLVVVALEEIDAAELAG